MLARLRSFRPSGLQAALLVSVGLHVLLLTLRFVDPERYNRVFQDTPLEVILVNARSTEAPPPQAALIAQANLAGGGDVEQARATSPLPPSELNAEGDAPVDARQRQIDQMLDLQQQLLAQIRREVALLPPPDPNRLMQTPEEVEREERRRQMLRMLAEIEKRINDENSRPKKRYISPATREEVYALYYDNLRRRIEERGTRDFPEVGGRKLYGELTMNLTIDARGKVIEADVIRPSSSSQLNRRAVAIVHAAGPFGPFTPEMRRQADQIVVTSRFRFTRADGLETSLSTQR